jgi:hypothetical protein
MQLRAVALALVTVGLAATAAAAADVCHSIPGGQFGESRWCVSSVLPPQAGNNYGPEHLAGAGADGAWCEGVPGPGIGQIVTLHMKPPGHFRTVTLTNGYAKTADTFRRNGRVKRALIETSRGFKTTVTVKDNPDGQRFVIPKTTAAWVRLTIVEVYPGTRGTDTCLSWFSVDLEELNG